jgi:4-hydroxybenzoate polyprenyltransferase
MLKDIALYIKHPYTAGTIAVIWLGTFGLYASDQNLPIVKMVFINTLASLFLSYLGFRPSR